MPRAFRIIMALLVVLAALCFYIAFFLTEARAHSWYDPECCSGKDCRPAKDVVVRDDGSIVITTEDGISVIVPPSLPRRQSHDNKWHVCPYPSSELVLRARCVYEPGNV